MDSETPIAIVRLLNGDRDLLTIFMEIGMMTESFMLINRKKSRRESEGAR